MHTLFDQVDKPPSRKNLTFGVRNWSMGDILKVGSEINGSVGV